MLLQQSPFRGEDEDEIYDSILADEPLYPIYMARDSVAILQKLLTREPELRLGSGPTDAQEVMSEPFFRNINWDDIYHKRVEPPFKPTIKSPTDTSNFDSEFTSVTPVLTPVNTGMFIFLCVAGIFRIVNTMSNSPVASYAGAIPWILVYGRVLRIRRRWTQYGRVIASCSAKLDRLNSSHRDTPYSVLLTTFVSTALCLAAGAGVAETLVWGSTRHFVC